MNTRIITGEDLRQAPCRFMRARTAVISCLGLVCLLSAAPALAQTNIEIIDSWTAPGLAGWTNTASLQSVLSNPGGYLNMRFAAQSQPDFVYDVMQRDSTGLVVTNISFRFMASNTPPSALRVYFHSPVRGNSWYINLDPPAVGDWVNYSVPVNITKAWSMGPGGTLDQLNSDIEWIDWVGVYVRRNGDSAAQNYCLDDFSIKGFQLLDSDGDGMPDAWELAHNLDPFDPSDALLDSDGDGVSNLDEYRAGTDPQNANDKFTIQMDNADPVKPAIGVVVQWNSVRNRTYSVYRSMDLSQGFSIFASGIPGNPPVNYFNDTTATNAGPYFYKVTVE